MPATTHSLKTDATLEELRAAAPRDERELALIVGFVWWLISTLTLLAGTFLLPMVIEHGIGELRVFGAAWGLAVAISHVTWMRRLSTPATYQALFAATLLAVLTNLAMMLVAPTAVAALTFNLLPSVMFAAYFLDRRQAATVTAVATVCAIVPLIYAADASAAERMTSRLTIWLPVMWLTALAIHLQKRERREAVADARIQATTDPLTGVANVRELRRRAAAVLGRGRAVGRASVLLLVDIDDLKEINAVYGNEFGDTVLRSVASALERATGPGHLVSRISGDLFAVLIDDADRRDVPALTSRYRGAARSAASQLPLGDLRLDVGVGVALVPDDGDDFFKLLSAADDALEREKRRHGSIRTPVPGGQDPPNHHLDSTAGSDRVNATDRQASERTANLGGGFEVEEVPKSERPVFWGRPLHALSAVVGWYLAILLSLLSLAMPDADHSHIDIAIPVIAAMFVPATLNFFFTPRIGSVRHLVHDLITLAAVASVARLTGGSESPVAALVFLFLIHDGWFMRGRDLAARFIAVALVLVSPVLYEDLDRGQQFAPNLAAIFMALFVALEQMLAMGLNRTYIMRAEHVAARLADLDPLTGLLHRQAFERVLARRLKRLRHENLDGIAVVMLDLDNFRRVNSQHGYDRGDELLCKVADALREQSRSDDVIARMGADEFAILIPAGDERDARTLAQRLVNAVNERVSRLPYALEPQVSARAGFSLYPTHGHTLDDLISAAELALLTVKASGRPTRVSRIVVEL